MEEQIVKEAVKKGAGSVRRRRLDVWPIRNGKDYDLAIEAIEKLVLRDDLSETEEAQLDILTALVEAYDKEHHSIDPSRATPINLLRSLMEDHAMSASDLGRLLGSRSLGSLILNGRRQLSKAHIKKLSEHFGLSPAAFL